MCGYKPTNNSRVAHHRFGGALATLALAATSSPVFAQIDVLEEITVTAQKRQESLFEVPISVATLSGENLDVLFSGSEDILGLSGRVPGLYAESSNGRAAPRFYLRGLGNIDFDLAASQPVLIVMDEVVMENAALRSFPIFDMEQVEVIRGPQGTLFGRNTTAGIIKFNSRRPTEELDGYVRGSWATFNTINVEGAIGGQLADGVNARFSGLYRTRDNWITNAQTGEESLGDYNEAAARLQFDWAITDKLSALVSLQARDLDGTSSIFRGNVFTTGSNDLNQNYDRERVFYDDGDNNPQGYQSEGLTLNLGYDASAFTFTSITSFQQSEGSSRGDIDGGVANIGSAPQPPEGITFADIEIFGIPSRTWPGPIFVPSVTEDSADVEQFTQEFRFASDDPGPFSWQFGAFYFDSTFDVTTENFASAGFDTTPTQDTKIRQENTTWAVFGQASYDITEAFNVTGGLRYTDDKRDFNVLQFAQLWIDTNSPILDTPPISVSDSEMSWELSANWAVAEQASLYGRYSRGFRGQTIQGRDVAFEGAPTVAAPEIIDSIEFGYKADLLDSRMRINAAVFAYEVDDLQLSIIGGAGNINQVINADKGAATGLEVDLDWLIVDNLLLSAGAAWNNTEIQDATLGTVPCGSGLCTPLDPVDPSDPDGARVLIDGNPFPRAPETTFNLNLRYTLPLANGNEFFALTDWVYFGKINMPLYEAIEFQTDGQFEGGLRVGYSDLTRGWTAALFGRNITDENNTLGFVDFSNNTGFVNEPRVWGIEFSLDFGE